MILGMPWLACHNLEIDWKIGEVKMMRCLEEYKKQWRLKQRKSGWQKQKKEKAKEEARREQEEKEKEKKEKQKKQKKEKMIDIKRIVEEWKIWEEEKKAAKLEVEAKKLVPEKFHKWIKVFSKKQSEWIPTRKVWNHAIDVRKGFVPRKRKVYPLSREERGSTRIYQGTVKKRVHQALEIAPNSVSILCKKEG